MKILIILLFIAIVPICTNAQTLSPSVTPSAGGYFTGGGNSLSWTMGETFNTTLQSGNKMLTQGFQQPYILLKILNLKAFIEGFYAGAGQMLAVLYNNDPFMYSPNACDSIMVELHTSFSPYDLVASVSILLHTDGSATAIFPSSLVNNSYYIVLRHRNTLETWSKVPLLFNAPTVSFDFTSP